MVEQDPAALVDKRTPSVGILYPLENTSGNVKGVMFYRPQDEFDRTDDKSTSNGIGTHTSWQWCHCIAMCWFLVDSLRVNASYFRQLCKIEGL